MYKVTIEKRLPYGSGDSVVSTAHHERLVGMAVLHALRGLNGDRPHDTRPEMSLVIGMVESIPGACEAGELDDQLFREFATSIVGAAKLLAKFNPRLYPAISNAEESLKQ